MSQPRKSSAKSPGRSSARARISSSSYKVKASHERERGDSIIERLRRPSEADSQEKQAKSQRRQTRARLSQKVKMTSKTDASARNPVITEVVESFLGQSMSVFHARWQTSSCLTDDIIVSTPLFWYKRHKWTAKDIIDFFSILSVDLGERDLESDLKVIYSDKKKQKKKKKKRKHLRKKSMQNLAKVRSQSVKHYASHSLVLASTDEMDLAAIKLWNLFTRWFADGKTEINQDQFNICLNENKIIVDPDISLDLFWELIVNAEEYDEYKRYKNQKKRENHKHRSGRSSRHGSRQVSGDESEGSNMTGALSDNAVMDKKQNKTKSKRKSGSHRKYGNNLLLEGSSTPQVANKSNKSSKAEKTKNGTKVPKSSKHGKNGKNGKSSSKSSKNSQNDDKRGKKDGAAETAKMQVHLKNKRFQSDILSVKQGLVRRKEKGGYSGPTSPTSPERDDESGSDSDNEMPHSPHLKMPDDNVSIDDLRDSKKKLDQTIGLMGVQQSVTQITPQPSASVAEAAGLKNNQKRSSSSSGRGSKRNSAKVARISVNGAGVGALGSASNGMDSGPNSEANSPQIEGKVKDGMKKISEKDRNNPLIYNPAREEIEKAEDFTSIKSKKVKKQFINVQHFKKIMKANKKLIKRHDTLKHASELSLKKRNLVIFGKIFSSIASGNQFDVSNDFLAERLTEAQLNNITFLLGTLDNRKSDWRHRLQILEFIENNLDSNPAMEPFYDTENFLSLIYAWCAQLYDDRSNITKAAAELFPSVFASLLRNVDPSILFEELNFIETLLESFFVLLRNRRAKQLAGIAHDTVVAVVDIFASVAEDCEQDAYQKIMTPLVKHCKIQFEKHEIVRAGCISCVEYILYGIMRDENSSSLTSLQMHSRQNSNELPKHASTPNTPGDAAQVSEARDAKEAKESKEADDNNEDKKESERDSAPQPKNIKAAKIAERAFLLRDEVFVQMMDNILLSGVNDKGSEVRERAMKFLKKMEPQFADLFANGLNRETLQKYGKWKKFNAPKKKRVPITRKRMKISRKALKKQKQEKEKETEKEKENEDANGNDSKEKEKKKLTDENGNNDESAK